MSDPKTEYDRTREMMMTVRAALIMAAKAIEKRYMSDEPQQVTITPSDTIAAA